MAQTAQSSPCSSTERGAHVVFPPPLVFLGGILGGIALRAASALPIVAPPLRVVGGLLIALAVSLILSARIWFTRTGQSPIPWKPTPELILRGPYRFTRNPMYLGMTLLTLGLGLAVDNLWISLSALPALLIVHFLAVLPEERYLTDRFGASYTEFNRRVRRYL